MASVLRRFALQLLAGAMHAVPLPPTPTLPTLKIRVKKLRKKAVSQKKEIKRLKSENAELRAMINSLTERVNDLEGDMSRVKVALATEIDDSCPSTSD